jgi:fumarate hydratase class II
MNAASENEPLFGPETQRAIENFPVSGQRMPAALLRVLALIKRTAAELHAEEGRLPRPLAAAIVEAANEIAAGKHGDAFPVDVFQTGSGTSTHMNMNEVIARRAAQILQARGQDMNVDPHDHVNLAQSSNDVFPTAVHITAAEAWQRDLRPALEVLQASLEAKARAFDHVVKVGRTHLMAALPVRLGQELSGYAAMVGQALRRVLAVFPVLCEVPLGGTAVGTGFGAPSGFGKRVLGRLGRELQLPLSQSANLFEGTASRDGLVEASAVLRSAAISLTKIANDIRLMGTDADTGLGELRLPTLQPGSSIMPGKVNPVMCEMLVMVCAQVIGCDATIAWSGAAGQFELNAMVPVMAANLLFAIHILAQGARLFAQRCVEGLLANDEHCREVVERSAPLATALAPLIGYDKAAALVSEAAREGKTLHDVALAQGFSREELERLFDVRRLTELP